MGGEIVIETMKHLFIVHSNITYLAALGAICKENLASEDVVILGDNYHAASPIVCHPIEINLPLKTALKHPTQTLRPVRYVDAVIERLTGGEPYVLYVQMLFNIQRIALTNPKCKGLNFIEEGLSVYRKSVPMWYITANARASEKLPYRNKTIKDRLRNLYSCFKGYSSRMMALPFLYTGYFNVEGVKFYGFSHDSFVGVDSVEVISFSDIVSRFEIKCQINLTDKNIWIGNNAVRIGVQTLEQYLAGIDSGVIKNLESGTKMVAIKFHPTEQQDSRDGTVKLFEDAGIETQIIDDAVVLELELLNSTGVTLWGVDSTLLYYAARQGLKCNSIINHLPDFPHPNIPQFWDSVTLV